MEEVSFWDKPREAREIIRQLNRLKAEVTPWQELEKKESELSELFQLAMEEKEESLISEVAEGYKELNERLKALEFTFLMDGENDYCNAFLSIHAGAGGTESCDWAEMLLRMYLRWAERKGYKVDIIDLLHGEEAGIKSITALIKGDHAHGYLKAENGVHRLVRISPFDAAKRRHTSFSSVDVVPEVKDEEIEILPSDLKIDTYRASGAGGQHVNVTDSAVRITHIPTKIVAQCQNERSQHQNKETALKVLKARLHEHYRKKKEEEILKEKGKKGEIAWGSQIRSYVFHPYSMVKDHRTNLEIGNVSAVMDGDIDRLIEAWIRREK
jgi:peptide chain release factor 2